jgi:predicted O-methyltransferase YrrM
MNQVLRDILASKTVTDGQAEYPLDSSVDQGEGELIGKLFRLVKPEVSVEIGLAYGISTLFACEALAANGRAATHHVIDPFQRTYWHGIGLRNLERAGYSGLIYFHELRSEIALPRLLDAGTHIQAAVIDGYHTFDHTLVDFFYVNKMLDVGGIIMLDDIQYPAVALVAKHILTYPAYQWLAELPDPAGRTTRTKIRRALAHVMPAFRRHWDATHFMAFRKVAEDTRNYDWHSPF